MTTECDNATLKCPECGNTGEFKIAATVWVKVCGDDYTEVLDEDGDREYGSEDACRCMACNRVFPLYNFTHEPEVF